jgi:hypothetical protein
MTRQQLRKLVDTCYQEFMEQPESVPSTKWADQIIDRVFEIPPDVREPGAMHHVPCTCIYHYTYVNNVRAVTSRVNRGGCPQHGVPNGHHFR